MLTRIDWLAMLPAPSLDSARLHRVAASPLSGATSSEAADPSSCLSRARAAARLSWSIRSASSPGGSRCSFSSPSRTVLMRSMAASMTDTASPVTAMPSRNLPISVSAACVSA